MNNLEIAQQKLIEAQAAVKAAQDEIEKAKKVEWPGLKYGDDYWVIDQNAKGFYPLKIEWAFHQYDNKRLKSGNFFTSLAECQRYCDMLNYQLLVRRKALEMDGLLGYGFDVGASILKCSLVYDYCLDRLIVFVVHDYSERQPLTPLMNKDCAQTLVNDPELIEAAKKAWGASV